MPPSNGLFFNYRVEKRILPVLFFFHNYGMLQDIELKFCIEILQNLFDIVLKKKFHYLRFKLSKAS